MSDRTRLIVFEGADAAGKSTISAAVCQRIREQNFPVQLLSFPGQEPGTLGEHVYRLHHHLEEFKVNGLTATSLQALHIAAHLDAIESTILPLLATGSFVVLDRFWWSTFVYGVVAGADPNILTALIEAEKRMWGEHQPRQLFYVTRRTPLRDEPTDKWQRWNQIYRDLSLSEQGRYPISTIENENSLDESISKALALLAL